MKVFKYRNTWPNSIQKMYSFCLVGHDAVTDIRVRNLLYTIESLFYAYFGLIAKLVLMQFSYIDTGYVQTGPGGLLHAYFLPWIYIHNYDIVTLVITNFALLGEHSTKNLF